jgi:hypothetical protein
MRRLTIERTAIIVVFMMLFAVALRVPMDTDTWWHLRVGEAILQSGFVTSDTLSHTMAGQPWVNHSWGAQIVMTLFWRAGDFGLALYTAVLATGGMAFVYVTCRASNVYVRLFAVVLGAVTASVFWSARPQMFTFLFSAVALWLLWGEVRQSGRRIWVYPLMMLVWANLHAGFSVGFILLGIVIAGEGLANLLARALREGLRWRGVGRLIGIGLLSVAAILVNPRGADLLAVPFQTLGIGALQNFIQEWASPDFHQPQSWPFIALLFGVLGAAAASPKRITWTEFLLVAGTGFMALTSGRNIALFAVAATPVFCTHLDAALTARGWVLRPLKAVPPRIGALNLLLIVLAGVGLLAYAAGTFIDPDEVRDTQAEVLPVAAVEALLAERPPGNLFNSYNWGGYLSLYAPEYPVYVDGRTDVYGDRFLTQDFYRVAVAAPGWQDTLARYGVGIVLIEPQTGLAFALRETPGWRIAWEDDVAVLFVAEPGAA